MNYSQLTWIINAMWQKWHKFLRASPTQDIVTVEDLEQAKIHWPLRDHINIIQKQI
jgi:hypothetical protein